MTSRPSLGVSQRQPQPQAQVHPHNPSQSQPPRSLNPPSISASGLSQRPPSHQRSLSQQHLQPQSQVLSPTRRADGTLDHSAAAAPATTSNTPQPSHQQHTPQNQIQSLSSPADPSVSGDASQSRFVNTPRRAGGSRLRLELANDGIDHAGFSESPQNPDPLSAARVFTPSRIMPPTNEPSEMGDMSPHTSRCQTADSNLAPLPMPPRRARFVVPISRTSSSKPAAAATTTAPPPSVRRDNRAKPYAIETPIDAPRYPNLGKAEPTGFADFVPWTGRSLEDKLTDSAIRHGYADKSPGMPGQDSSSARTPLLPALKHKSGLHSLSTVFTTILNQRRHSGQITSASTFKPPPRVTLTDTKREVWLKDLANPVMSLRRLSRTIPHGIRGKILLEQCLNKNVPTDRAVWLAKCVGANEIRAFKRKGVNGTVIMGGEAKWIRDWTIFVEQFVEGIVNSFSDSDWKAKVTYAIRLATHLYSEHLLDREHYMDWLVAGLESCPQAKLPMWLLVVQIYWRDLVQLRRYGRRLVSALLQHHSVISEHPDRDILLPLASKLSTLVQFLLVTSPENFVQPLAWAKYRGSLLTSLPPDDSSKNAIFKSVDSRNDCFSAASCSTQPAMRSNLVKALDKLLRTPMGDDAPAQLWKLGENKVGLVRTVLEWCTSLYRPGVAKIYVAARLLRAWSTLDADITAAILDFIDTDPLQELARKHHVYHLVSELVRTGHFSVPRYIQWLIARGGLSGPFDTHPDGPCVTRLLVEVPIHSLNGSMMGLRATLLMRSAYSVEDEANDINSAIRYTKRALSLPLSPDDPLATKKPMSVSKLAKKIGISSRALQSEIGSWLCDDFIAPRAESIQTRKEGIEALQFNSVRTLLEAAQDFSTLERVIRIVMPSSSADLLSQCADTISLHLPAFAALGAATTLFEALYGRLKAISEGQGVGVRPLLASLTGLAPRLPGKEAVASQLQKDLIRADRSTAVDISSPLSDNMMTHLEDAETELNEQIEKLANYSSADRPTIERLFQAIIQPLSACWGKADERQRPYCMLLTRLRVFDMQHFDTMMKGWVGHIRKLKQRPPVSHIFPLLISSGCLSLEIIFATATRSQTQTGQSQNASVYMQEVLQMLMAPVKPSPFMTPEDCYKFRIYQEQARLDYAKDVMPLIRGALAEYAGSRIQQEPRPQPLDDEKTKGQLVELLRVLVLIDSDAACQTLSPKSPDVKLVVLIETLTTMLLGPLGGGAHKSFDQVLELANVFTLPFCQVKLSLNLAIDDVNSAEDSEKLQSQLELLSKAMDNAIDAHNVMWTGLLPCLTPEITQHLKIRAEMRFLNLFPSLKNPPMVDRVCEDDIDMAENLLTIIDAIIRGSSSSKTTPISNAMVEKLSDMWEILSTSSGEYHHLRGAVLSHWLPLLLSYLTLHASASVVLGPGEMSKTAGEIRGRAVMVLAGIMQELDGYRLYSGSAGGSLVSNQKSAAQLSRRIFDVALVLVDALPEEVRVQCVRALRDTCAEPRLRYIFSFIVDPAMRNLMLAHRDKSQQPLPQGGNRAQGAAGIAGNNGGSGTGPGTMLQTPPERLTPFTFRRWEILNEPTPNVGENDTSLSLTLFDARKL